MSETSRVATAGVLLLMVSALALLIRVTASPWYCQALVWLFAVKWALILTLDRTPEGAHE